MKLTEETAHIRLLEDVARHFFDKPKLNEDGTELRFGTHGSMSIDLTRGVWFDHEHNEGGGAIDLIMREAGCCDAREAYEWAEQNGYWVNDFPKTNGSGYAYGDTDPWEKLGEIVATYNYVDEKRTLLFQVLRFEPKTFRQRRPNSNGKVGWIRTRDIANKLHGTARRVRLLDLGAVWPECKPKDDISDWLDAGHRVDELGEIIAKIPDWKPDTVCSRLGVLDAGDDHELPPPREWLLGNEFCRGFLSSLLGDGGVGKSALRYKQCMSLALGRSLTGEHVFQRCRVLIISLEDDLPELRRRIWAIRLHLGIKEEELKGWLYLWSPGAKGGKLLTLDKHGNGKIGALKDNIEALIKECRIDLVVIDPFVKSHDASENDNQQIDAVMQILSDMCAKHNIAVDTPHHVNKASAKTLDPGDPNKGRGASAMKDAARLVYTLTTMSTAEAKSFGVSEEDRAFFIRKDKGKVNTVAPKRKAVWFKLVGVKLGNKTELYPGGDEVQTVEPWFAPDLWEDVSEEIMRRILIDIEEGLPDGRRYSHANVAKERAAWKVVTKHVPTKNETQAREVIRTWVEHGLLKVDTYTSPVSYKPESGLWVNKEKWNGSWTGEE